MLPSWPSPTIRSLLLRRADRACFFGGSQTRTQQSDRHRPSTLPAGRIHDTGRPRVSGRGTGCARIVSRCSRGRGLVGRVARARARRSRHSNRAGTLWTTLPSGGTRPRQQGGRLRLTILDLKDKDAAIAAAVRVPLCCEHCPVSPVGTGGGQALGLLVVRGRIADERRHSGPHYALMGP